MTMASPETDTKQIEYILKQEATQLSRQQEVDRILSLSVLDPFAVLEVTHKCTSDDVKNAYRNKSRLIHPDKTKHEHARDAFEKLKKAETELMDGEKRASILAMINEAKRELAAEWRAGEYKDKEIDMESPEFLKEATLKYRKIMVDIEWRRRQRLKQQMAAEGMAASKREKDEEERKRKRDAEKEWEESRDARVNSWRDFQAASKSKSKKKGAKKSKKSTALPNKSSLNQPK